MSEISIPNNEIFKCVQFDENRKPKNIYVFQGNPEPVPLSTVFSDLEVAEIEANQTAVLFSEYQIHKDDSIETVKHKIHDTLKKNNTPVSFEEIYVFAKITGSLHLNKFYQEITKNEETDITPDMLGQLFINLGIEDETVISEITAKNKYSYEDLVKYIGQTPRDFFVPLGKKFTVFRDLLFSGDPLFVENPPRYVAAFENPLFTFENSLLFQYGKIADNTLYFYSADDVLKYSTNSGISEEYMFKNYFPELYNLLKTENEDDSIQEIYEKQKNGLRTKHSVTREMVNSYQIIDLFYNIQRLKKNTPQPSYATRGIHQFEIIIHPEIKTVLPLDAIFKSIHATKQIPFIKYNPGNRRENIYRLYSEKITKSGNKIPILKRTQIQNLSKEIGKGREISFYISDKFKNQTIELTMDFQYNGNIRIRGKFGFCITIHELFEILTDKINSIIDDINGFLQKTGYKLNTFKNDDLLEVVELKYRSRLDGGFKIKEYASCLKQVFDITQITDKTADLIYKRVDNYNQMDEINFYITYLFKNENKSEIEIIAELKRKYNMPDEKAVSTLVNYNQNVNFTVSSYVNKNVNIVDNPGFPVKFATEQIGGGLTVEIEKIDSFEYIAFLETYLDSFFKIALNQVDAKNICSKKTADPPKINNIIVPNTVKIPRPRQSPPKGDIDAAESAAAEQETPAVAEDETPAVAEEETPAVAEEETPAVAEEETPAVAEEETPAVAEEETPAVAEEETPAVAEEETPAVAEKETPAALIDIDSDSDSDTGQGYYYESDEDDDEPSPKTSGGARSKITKDIPPNKYFSNKLHEKEPTLFLKSTQGKYKSYSRICQYRQPVILSDEEKTRIDKEHRNAYSYAMRYGSDPNKKNWYICPRFWCLSTNSPMTEKEAKEGKCDGKIHEFTSKYHVDAKGNYIDHVPGFLGDNSNPNKKLCVPCCFSKPWNSTQLVTRRDQCLAPGDVDNPTDGEQVADKKRRNPKLAVTENYINDFSKFPINQNRWGFLLPSIQNLLKINYNDVIEKNTGIKKNVSTFLHYGVEQSMHQSFLACIADIYAGEHNLKPNTPKIHEFRTILANSVTLDIYLKAHNGSLVSIFKPKKRRDYDDVATKYGNTEFYKKIDTSDESQMDFLKDSIASFENFLDFLKDTDSFIDHTYLWDVVTAENPQMFSTGLNLVIINIQTDDITDKIEIICPTNSYTDSVYDPKRKTVILIKKEEYYEPIYMYKQMDDGTTAKNGKIIVTQTFTEQSGITKVIHLLKSIQYGSETYCKARPSMKTKDYRFKQNISTTSILRILRTYQYNIHSQVMNYHGKIIGFMVSNYANISTDQVFIPSFPSPVIDGISLIVMDTVKWTNYVTTRDFLVNVKKQTLKTVLCEPMLKVVEDGMIVGIITETNQFLLIDPPVQNDIEDNLPVFQGHGYDDYFETNKTLAVDNTADTTRVDTARNISLETNFYYAFRTTLRIMLNEYENRDLRQQLIHMIDDQSILYTIKLKQIEILLRKLLKPAVSFVEISEEFISGFHEITTCVANCKDKTRQPKYCMVKGDNCILMIPRKNLLNGVDNENGYFLRISDELLRYGRIRVFLLEPNRYLNISQLEYSMNENEFILLQTLLDSDYLDKLIPFQTNKYASNIPYDLADPMKTLKYSNEISAEKMEASIANRIDDTVMLNCIQETREIIGNDKSYWKQVFPKSSQEQVLYKSAECTFFVIIEYMRKYRNEKISVNNVKTALIKIYKDSPYENKIITILGQQDGKKNMMIRVKEKKTSIENLIMSEEYYLTNLDLWAISDFWKLPILLFSTKEIKNLNLPVKWIVLGGDKLKDKYLFLRSPVDSNNTVPEYHLISPAYELHKLMGFKEILDNPDYPDNNLCFNEYLVSAKTLKQ
jgi:hypothetical protein